MRHVWRWKSPDLFLRGRDGLGLGDGALLDGHQVLDGDMADDKEQSSELCIGSAAGAEHRGCHSTQQGLGYELRLRKHAKIHSAFTGGSKRQAVKACEYSNEQSNLPASGGCRRC